MLSLEKNTQINLIKLDCISTTSDNTSPYRTYLICKIIFVEHYTPYLILTRINRERDVGK